MAVCADHEWTLTTKSEEKEDPGSLLSLWPQSEHVLALAALKLEGVNRLHFETGSQREEHVLRSESSMPCSGLSRKKKANPSNCLHTLQQMLSTTTARFIELMAIYRSLS